MAARRYGITDTSVIALLSLAATAALTPAHANPQGGTVVAGQATIKATGNTLDVTQTTTKGIIDWQSFSIAKGETTNFHLPNANSSSVERVLGPSSSSINGRLWSNGTIYLINPNGTIVGNGANINVGSFILSTADIDNSDYLAGRYNFSKASPNPLAAIDIQAGATITVRDTGLAAFVAPGVSNKGAINARLGQVFLGGAPSFAIDFNGDGLTKFELTGEVAQAPRQADGSVTKALVDNAGTIAADGGTVTLSARAARGVVDDVVRSTGLVQANSIGVENGVVVLSGGDNGQVELAGEIDAKGAGAGQTGGTVKVLGQTVSLDGAAKIDASGQAGGGTVLVGGDFHGGGAERRADVTLIAQGATISADATLKGDGGKVAVWSERGTEFKGRISAQGGAQGGDGGSAEVSSRHMLGYSGFTDLLAAKGKTGTLLLDPSNITISTAANSGITGASPFQGMAATSNLNVGTLETALGGANVTVDAAGGAGAGGGSITVSSDIAWANSSTLQLKAGRGQIALAASITAPLGTLDLGNAPTAAGVVQTAGSITVDTLTSSTRISGPVSLTSAGNSIGTLSDFITRDSGGFSLIDSVSLTLAGLQGFNSGDCVITSSGSINAYSYLSARSLILTSGGSIQEAGKLTLATLTGSAVSGATLINQNSIATLAGFTNSASGGFTLTNSIDLTITAPIDVGADTVAIFASATVNEAGGTITADTLTGRSTGGANFSASGNAIQTLYHFQNNGSGGLSIANSQSLVLSSTTIGTDFIELDINGAITQPNGSITASELRGSSVGGAVFRQLGNRIDTLGSFTNAGSSGLSLTNSSSLTVDGAITAGFVHFSNSGAIAQAGGSIVAGTLNGFSIGGATLAQSGNSIGTLAGFTNSMSGGFTLADSIGLAIAGTIADSSGGTIALNLYNGQSPTLGGGRLVTGGTVLIADFAAGDPIALGTGTGFVIGPADISRITAGTLTVTGAGNGLVNGLATGARIGGVVVSVAGDLQVNGVNAVNGSLSLNAGGLVQQAAGKIVVPTLSGSASGGATLAQSGNSIDRLNGFANTGGGGFSLVDAVALTVSGDVSAGAADLSISTGGAAQNLILNASLSASGTIALTSSGTIAQTAGTIAGAGLTGSSAGGATLSQAGNAIATLAGFANTGGGGFNLADGSALTVSSALSAGAGDLTLTTGSLTLGAALSASGLVTLAAAGAITQSGGTVTGATLAGSSAGGATLAQSGNSIGALAGFANAGAGGFTLSDALGLSVTGVVSAGANDLVLTSGGSLQTLAVAASLSAGGSVSLLSTGKIIQSQGAITAATLIGSSVGGATLGQAGNSVGTLGAFSNASAGGFTLADAVGLTLAGAVTNAAAGPIELDLPGNRALGFAGGSLATTGVVALTDTQPGDVVTLGAGTGFDVSSAVLNGITAGVLTINGAGAGAIAGAITGTSIGAVSLNVAGSVTVSGTNVINKALTVTAGGSVTQTGGSLTTATLSGSSTGGATLAGPQNAIGTLAGFANAGGGGFSLTTSGALTVSGTVTAGTAGLALNTGGLGLDANLSAGGLVTLASTGAIAQSSGTITASTLAGASVGGATLSQTGNLIGTLDNFANVGSGGLSLADASALTLTGLINSGSGALKLLGVGTIIQTAGSIKATSLTGLSAGGATLSQTGNAVGTLSGFANTGSGGFTLADSRPLIVSGTVSAGTDGLKLTTGALTLAANLSAGGLVSLASTGGIAQSAGAIEGGTLSGSSVGGATLAQSGNSINTLASFTNAGTGGLQLSDATALILAGSINSGADTFSVNGASSITQTSGSITAVRFTGSSAGGATLSQRANAIGTLAGFANSGAGGFSLTDGGSLTVSSDVAAGAAGLSLAAANLTLAADLSAGGNVAVSGPIVLSRNVTISSAAAGVSLDGSVDAGLNGSKAGLTVTAGAGAVTLGGSVGDISPVRFLSVNARSIALGSSSADQGSQFQIHTIGRSGAQAPVTTQTPLSLQDGDVILNGPVNFAGQRLILDTTGSGTALHSGGRISLKAGVDAPDANLMLLVGDGQAVGSDVNIGKLIVLAMPSAQSVVSLTGSIGANGSASAPLAPHSLYFSDNASVESFIREIHGGSSAPERALKISMGSVNPSYQFNGCLIGGDACYVSPPAITKTPTIKNVNTGFSATVLRLATLTPSPPLDDDEDESLPIRGNEDLWCNPDVQDCQ
jgi:filamentous hemagglutinin family protein